MAADVIRYLRGPSVHGPGPALLVRAPSTLRARIARTADGLARAVGAASGRSHAVGEWLIVRCPNERVGRALLAAALARLDGASLESALAAVLAAWERPAEAALLARAARAADVPVMWVPPDEGWLFLGQGRRGRAYHHGYLGGARELADDKLASSRRLETAGVPTAGAIAVANEVAAIQAARSLGYPVVVKPSRAWAQVGVWTELRSAADVRRAFRRAKAQAGVLAMPMLVERHVDGRYVRATLVDGALVAALTTGPPPSVTGDGRRSIAELAGAVGDRVEGILESVLASQGLDRRAVVRRGNRVRIGLPNHGDTIDITTRLHRTTRDVLARVGALFPAPVLGVDLLLRDPSGRFDPARDVVLEVNPAPAFALHERVARGRSRDLAPRILAAIAPGRVRVIARRDADAAIERLAARAAARGLHPAGWSRGRAWSGSPDRVVGHGPDACVLPVLDERADLLLYSVDRELAESGVPF